MIIKKQLAFTAMIVFFLCGFATLTYAEEPINFGVGSCSTKGVVFEADTHWLNLPEDHLLGDVTAVEIGNNNHLWILHRPESVTDAVPGKALPPIVEFDDKGNYVKAFGGPSDLYEWPDREHSMALSESGHIWISGSAYLDLDPGRGDDMLIVLDTNGQFIRQIGHRGSSQGNLDRENLDAPADIYIDNENQEVYVADGYGNQRVIVFSEKDGRFLRMWGAYGSDEFPEINSEALEGGDAHQHFAAMHGIEMSVDRKIYASDRPNQRVQIFTEDGVYLDQVQVNPGFPSPLTASGIDFSADNEQKYMFVVDWGNSSIEVFDRQSLSHLGTIGGPGTEPGEFLGPHLIDIDSNGVIYVSEVQGARMQRLIPCNTENGAVTW
jgi:DNA-binding beta-propeller fold protein YncE